MLVNKECKRLFLWSGPRNISTTLMYSFAQREDTSVYDEPLYAAYLNHSSARAYHPSSSAILDSLPNEYETVVSEMLSAQPTPVAFFKNMAHHLLHVDRAFMLEGINIILTRDPQEMLPSFDKVIQNPKIDDVGYKAHVGLLDYFEQNSMKYVVLDATLLLKNPEGVLRKLCEATGILFDHKMLSWPSGPRAEDGIWAKHWYANVHKSSGFRTYHKKEAPFPQHLMPLLSKCKPFYDVLREKSLY